MSKVSFTPNTITYTAKGDEAKKIKKSKVGVVVHTKYHGKDIEHMHAEHDVDHENFKHHEDVHHHGAEKELEHVHHTPEKEAEFHRHMAAAKHIHDTHGKKMYPATEKHSGEAGHLASYSNAVIKNNEHPSAEGFKKHVEGHYEKAAAKLKTEAGKAKKRAEGASHTEHIEKNKEHYGNLLQMHHHLQSAKNALVHSLDTHEGRYEHHINGKKTKPEGYVVHHEHEGQSHPSKLVNRHEFAKANFERGAARKKEAE